MNKRIIILISIIIILVIGWVVMVYIPASRDLGKLSKQLAALEEKERKLIPYHQIRIIQAEVDSLTESLDDRMKRFYPEEQLLDLGRTIENIGKQYSLHLVSITPDYESLPLFVENDKEISELPLTIEFKGDFEQFTQFLDDIPKFSFVMRFHGLIFHKMDANKKELDITLEGVIALQRMKSFDKSPGNVLASIGIANQT